MRIAAGYSAFTPVASNPIGCFRDVNLVICEVWYLRFGVEVGKEGVFSFAEDGWTVDVPVVGAVPVPVIFLEVRGIE